MYVCILYIKDFSIKSPLASCQFNQNHACLLSGLPKAVLSVTSFELQIHTDWQVFGELNGTQSELALYTHTYFLCFIRFLL